MQVGHTEVFDETISGTSGTWYSPANLNALLGAADRFVIMAFATSVSGSSPTLTVRVEHSADNQNWISAAASAEISGAAISNNTVLTGTKDGAIPVLLAFVRLKITLGGTSPQCRLKIQVTGRTIV